MTKDEKVCVTTPWWDEPHEGVITKKFHTPVENYYVIEFPNGEMITVKESEIKPNLNSSLGRYNYCRNEMLYKSKDFWSGYLMALWIEDRIKDNQWDVYRNSLDEEYK